MWHFTDVFYHTDADRLDMVSAEEMKNVGISALATAYTLASADETTTIQLIEEIQNNAIERLTTEYELSKEAIDKGSSITAEQHIIEVWTSWYKEALAKMSDIHTKASTKLIKAKIAEAIHNVDSTYKSLNALLEKQTK